MAIYAISEATLTALADEVRSKIESDAMLSPADMINAIHGIVAHTRDVDGLLMRTSTSLESLTATLVADYALFSNQKIEDVSLPAVTKIGEYAFCSCGNLESVNSGAVEIGSYAFYGCDHLQDFTWADGIIDIGVGAFDGCASLTTVNLRNAAFAALSASAFANSGVTELWLPEGRFCSVPNDSTFAGSPIGLGGSGGVIYVPLRYRFQYESNSKWTGVFKGGQNRIVSY